MKKLLKGLSAAFVGVFALFGFASCNQTTTHQHVAKEGWVKDSAQHWNECVEDGEMMNVAIHTYGAWVIDTEVDHAKNKDGSRHRDCTVCGFRMKQAIKAMPIFYVKGGLNGWSAKDEYKLVVDTEKATGTLTGVVFEKDIEWKIATEDWSNETTNLDEKAKEYFEVNGNIKCKVAGTYTITVTDLLGAKVISVVKTA